jgi:hypothetical protein
MKLRDLLEKIEPFEEVLISIPDGSGHGLEIKVNSIAVHDKSKVVHGALDSLMSNEVKSFGADYEKGMIVVDLEWKEGDK